jgi:hypothetical protein
MPYPNQHSARQTDPAQYKEFRRFSPKGFPEGIDVILGLKEDGDSEIQSVRADSSKFSAEEFAEFLRENGFEADIEEATSKSFEPFSTWIPIELISKGEGVSDDDEQEDENNSLAYIRGVVSTDDTDFEGERVEQRGLDWSYFLKNGWFNHEHRPGPEAILGHPLKIEQGEHSTTVEGVLYLEKPLAKEIYTTAVAMRKAGGDRSLGFSIEGQVTARNNEDTKVILGARVINCAITAHPMNPNTNLEVIARSMTGSVGYQDAAIPDADAALSALVEQSLEGRKASATYGGTIKPSRLRAMLSAQFNNDLSEEELDSLMESILRLARSKA